MYNEIVYKNYYLISRSRGKLLTKYKNLIKFAAKAFDEYLLLLIQN